LELYSDVNIPAHRKKKRSLEKIKDVARQLKYLNDFWIDAGINPKTAKVHDINDDYVGKPINRMEDGMEPRTINKYLGTYKFWFDHVMKHYTKLKENPFDFKIPWGKNKINEIIKENEFSMLLYAIKNGERYEIDSGGHKRIRYYDWLVEAFWFTVLTGARRQDLAEMRYTNINIDDDGSYIELPNLKSNRI